MRLPRLLRLISALTAGATVGALLLGPGVSAAPDDGVRPGTTDRWVVLYAEGAPLEQSRSAVRAAGGTVVAEDTDIGVATVTTTRADFRAVVSGRRGIAGVARDRVLGRVPQQRIASRRDLERGRPLPVTLPSAPTAPSRATASRTTAAGTTALSAGAADEPLAALQWDMRVLRTAQAHAVEAGDRRVLVAVIDTGVDGSHPDVAPVLDRDLSRNFTTDVPTDPGGTALDGPCEVPSCRDPADVDEDGHGTHVASTIASPVNGRGIAGVAPGVRIVSIRAGQDSGYFFLQPTLDAVTYAGRIGVDVANLSFYVDPWLFNCDANPRDTPAEQDEQRTIKAAVQRAVDFAWKRGVTLVAAAGNDGLDLGAPGVDTQSPDYPQDTPTRRYSRDRTLDAATCASMPSEARHVLDVTATGPSGRKSYFSSYGTEQATVAAPGGDALDAALPEPRNRILAATPYRVLVREGLLNADGTPRDAAVVRSCQGTSCSYYRWLQGTSMAAPHAAGVAALIVSRHGGTDPRDRRGMTLRPSTVERLLRASANDRSCPVGRVQRYEDGTSHTCAGSAAFNGFYGDGVVDALRAVS